MEIIIIFAATALFIIYAFMILTASSNITEAILTCKKEIVSEDIRSITLDMNRLVEKMKRRNELDDKKSIKKGKELKGKLDAKQKELAKLENGKLGFKDFLPVAGYRLIQLMKWDSKNSFIQTLNAKCIQFKEKREAINFAYYITANLIGCIALGIIVSVALLGIFLSFHLGIKSIIFSACIFVIFGIIGYLPLDSVTSTVNARKEEIDSQFPQVASQLTLLTISGMEVNQAWKLVAESGEGVLYNEMNRVILDLNNNVSPAEAYSKMMIKCNNNYVNKLATAIIQNTAKGNSEIVNLFRRLNDECWIERKHSSKRMGEKIQSKLLVPTLLMFGGILLLVVVPVLSGFNF